MSDNTKLTYIGETDFRNKRTPFGIRPNDRLRHVYVIGKTGMGKSTLLENMATQDILNNEGLCFVDPHGGSAELLLDYVPEHRINDVIYFAPFDAEHPIAMNPLEDVDPDKRHLVVSGLLSVFGKIWEDAWSARMEYILMNSLLALLEYPESTLLSVNRVLTDKEFRKLVIEKITDPTVKSFWVDEYNTWDDRYRKEAGAAIQNKVNQFATNVIVRNIVGQPKSSFDLRDIMDNKKILIVNLSKGQIGEKNAQLLGGMLITKLYLAAMSRADLEAEELAEKPPFYFYVDEFQSFANESFADILSEARKYKLGLVLAHQYVAQMPDEVRDAVVGNVGTMVVFRVGPADAELFAREFAPIFTEEDIVNLGKYQFYLRLMIDGVGSQPFSSAALKPIIKPDVSFRERVIETSHRVYSKPRKEVEEHIYNFFTPIPSEKDIEHQSYIEKKKAEFKAAGKEWVDFSKEPEKKNEYSKEKATGYHKPSTSSQPYKPKPQVISNLKPANISYVSKPVEPPKKEEPAKPQPVQTKPIINPVPPAPVHKPLSNSLKSLLDNLDGDKEKKDEIKSPLVQRILDQNKAERDEKPKEEIKKINFDSSKKANESSLSMLKQALMKAGVTVDKKEERPKDQIKDNDKVLKDEPVVINPKTEEPILKEEIIVKDKEVGGVKEVEKTIPVPKKETIVFENRKKDTQPIPSQQKGPKEVPEDVLRRLLEE